MIHEAPIVTVKDMLRRGAKLYQINNEKDGTYLATVEMPDTGILNQFETNPKEMMEIQPTSMLDYMENKYKLRNPPFQELVVYK